MAGLKRKSAQEVSNKAAIKNVEQSSKKTAKTLGKKSTSTTVSPPQLHNESEDENMLDGVESDDEESLHFPEDDKISKVQKKTSAMKMTGTEKTGVVYLGHIPHGFYENEMRAYFSQFGSVTRLRLSRNKKTGHSRHFAFIEFASDTVAQVVADTMNNYILYDRVLKCKVISLESIHATLWDGCNRNFKVVPWQDMNRKTHNRPRSVEDLSNMQEKQAVKLAQKKQKLKDLGIDYDVPEPVTLSAITSPTDKNETVAHIGDNVVC